MSSSLNDIVILLVENNEEDRTFIAKTLSRYFKKIIKVEDGKSAYEYYKEDKNIDMIICGIDMPGIDGIELLRLIRITDLYIPFILTTSKIDANVLLSAVDLGVNSFLLKPIDLTKLLQKVDILCEKKLFEKRIKVKQNEIENYISSVDKVALIFKMRENGDITYMNESMLMITKYEKSDIDTLTFNDIIHPDIPKKYLSEVWEIIKNGKLWRGNTKFISKDKEIFYLNNTVFKIVNASEEDEYITIAFLTTKENLEKRDFQKKVILNIKEANQKEYQLNREIEELKNQLISCNNIVNLNNNSNAGKLEAKLKNKEKQIEKFEEEITFLNEKYEKMLKAKKEEVERHVNQLQGHKQLSDKLKDELRKKDEELDVAHEKIEKLLTDIIKKDKTIKDLRFIIEEGKEES